MKKTTNQSGEFSSQDEEIKPTISIEIDPLSKLLDMDPGKAPSKSTPKRKTTINK